jgi:hypothetical protein
MAGGDRNSRKTSNEHQMKSRSHECGLEEMLRPAFPLDEMIEVPTGVNGADLLQGVRSRSGHPRC